jgi:hypothetical protein
VVVSLVAAVPTTVASSVPIIAMTALVTSAMSPAGPAITTALVTSTRTTAIATTRGATTSAAIAASGGAPAAVAAVTVSATTGPAIPTGAAAPPAATISTVPAISTAPRRRPAPAPTCAAIPTLRLLTLQARQLELDGNAALIHRAGLDHLVADRASQRHLCLGPPIRPGRRDAGCDRAIGIDEPERNVHSGYRTTVTIHCLHDQRLGRRLAYGGPLTVAGQRLQSGDGTVARSNDAVAAGHESKE